MSISRLYERKGQPLHQQLSDSYRFQKIDFSPQQCTRFMELTRTEIEERWLNRLCFNCDESFTQGHWCKKLFLIDSYTKKRENLLNKSRVLVQTTSISLQCIIDLTDPQNMHLQGKLKENSMISLVDSRSTRSFVDSKFVSQFNFQVGRQNG